GNTVAEMPLWSDFEAEVNAKKKMVVLRQVENTARLPPNGSDRTMSEWLKHPFPPNTAVFVGRHGRTTSVRLHMNKDDGRIIYSKIIKRKEYLGLPTADDGIIELGLYDQYVVDVCNPKD